MASDTNNEVSDPKTVFISTSGMGTPGDINGDGAITLTDAIVALQIAAGLTPPAGAIQAGYTPSLGDVNGDGKTGLPEVLYILQKTAGVR
jgi:hypothetical protein